MNRVEDCQNMCQRPEGRICTQGCIIHEEVNGQHGLDFRDQLLWQAMEALSPARPSQQKVLNDIESYFGVGENND